MRILGTEPSSVILSQTKKFKKWKSDAQKVSKQAKAKRDGVINPQNYKKYFDKHISLLRFIPGGTDILTWTDVGPEPSNYVTGFTLVLTNETNMSPVYYISMRGENGAGLYSTPITSTPIAVVEEDKPGLCLVGFPLLFYNAKSLKIVTLTLIYD